MKTTSVAVKGTSKWLDKEGDGRCLVVKTLVSFKNNGLLCRNCTHHLHRPPGIKSTTDLTIGKCGRCKNNFNLIGLECINNSCEARSDNRYCYPCLLVYLIARKEGQFFCSTEGHQFRHCSVGNNAPLSLCHFCSAACSDYYRDEQCNINLCFKCSLILDSKGQIAIW